MQTSNDSEDRSAWTDPRLTRKEVIEKLEKRVELLMMKKKRSAKFLGPTSLRIPEQYEQSILFDDQIFEKHSQEVGYETIYLEAMYGVCSVSNTLNKNFWLKCTLLSELLDSICQNFEKANAISSMILCRAVIEHIGMTVLAYDEFLQAEKRFIAEKNEKSKLSQPSFAMDLDEIMITRFKQQKIDTTHYLVNSLRTNIEKHYRRRSPVQVDLSAKDLMRGVKALNKMVKGARRVYDFASELTHPNSMYSIFYLQYNRTISPLVSVEKFNGRLDYSRHDLSLERPSEPNATYSIVAHRLMEVLQILGESVDVFIHIEKTMHRIADLATRDAKNRIKRIMKGYLANTGKEIAKADDLCPCLSGKEFRLCCALWS